MSTKEELKALEEKINRQIEAHKDKIGDLENQRSSIWLVESMLGENATKEESPKSPNQFVGWKPTRIIKALAKSDKSKRWKIQQFIEVAQAGGFVHSGKSSINTSFNVTANRLERQGNLEKRRRKGSGVSFKYKS